MEIYGDFHEGDPQVTRVSEGSKTLRIQNVSPMVYLEPDPSKYGVPIRKGSYTHYDLELFFLGGGVLGGSK